MSMTTDEMIAVIQAYKDGKQIQYRNLQPGAGWNDVSPDGPAWCFNEVEYRVKPEPPEPREFYLDASDPWKVGGYLIAYGSHHPHPGSNFIRVREVLD